MNLHKNRRILYAVGLMVLIFSIVYWRNASNAGTRHAGSAGPGGEPSLQAELFEVRKARLPDKIDGLIGTVKGNTLELTFNGQEERLVAANVRLGQRVKKGDILFELDHERSAARKSQAESNAQRARELQAAGGATQHDVSEAQASLAIATKDYHDTYIYASADGYISQINRQPGETVARNEVIGVLVSLSDRFYLETGVIESQLEQVRAGQRAIVEIEAFGHEPITGRVQGVSREVTTTGRTGTVQVSLPGAIQSKLRPGMSGRCKIYVFDEKTIPIPRTAYDVEKKGVYVVGEDNKAHFREVHLGHVTRDFYEIPKGLEEGERIVNDLTTNPVQDNAEVSASGEPQHYTDPDEKESAATPS